LIGWSVCDGRQTSYDRLVETDTDLLASLRGKNMKHSGCQPEVPRAIAATAIVFVVSLALSDNGFAQPVAPLYPAASPIEQYLAKSNADEITLARSAAPPSISAEATILVLSRQGYETAVEGTNGFVCFIQRSWAASFDDAEFWNPKIRAPNCFNALAARTELPQYLKRTQWVLAGAGKEQLIAATRSAFADRSFRTPELGAVSFMLSKEGYLNDEAAGPWLPHVMLFVPHGQTAAWGAGAEGSPVLGSDNSEIESTVLFIPVRRWSDGSPAPPPSAEQHTHK
jgi:hypothetical protein